MDNWRRGNTMWMGNLTQHHGWNFQIIKQLRKLSAEWLTLSCDTLTNPVIESWRQGAVFSYKLSYIVGFGFVEMAISTNPKPTIHHNLCENIGPVFARDSTLRQSTSPQWHYVLVVGAEEPVLFMQTLRYHPWKLSLFTHRCRSRI